MATFTKQVFSASSDGGPVLITGTSSGTSTLIHTAVNTAGMLDEVWLYLSNNDTVARVVTIQIAGTATANSIALTVPAQQGLEPGIAGLSLAGGVVVRAWCATANVISVFGYVNQITN